MYHKKYGVMPRAFRGLMEDMFSNNWNRVFADDKGTHSFIPVNIKETDAAYELHVIAPGLSKEDFKVNLEQDILTVSFEQKEESKEQDSKWLRSEYRFNSFKRSFTLNDKVNAAGINAKYNDGVLAITLPKKEAAEPNSQQISVA